MDWVNMPTSADWDRLVQAIRDANSVLLVAHVNPDGDTIGSALAVGTALRGLAIKVAVSFDEEPFAMPSSLAWMPGQEILVAPDDAPMGVDVAVSFDAGALNRLGRLAANAKAAKLFAAVDHHRSFTDFADVAIVDVDAPATAVLALELVDRLGANLTPEIASCLYAGLVTDTGSFKYVGTTAETHEIAARLHRAGIAHDQIARAVFDDQSFASMQLMGRAVTAAVSEPGALGGLGLIWTQITQADRLALALPLDAAEPIIDSIRTVHEAEVAVVFKEGDDGLWRVSTRSKGAVNLGEVCSALGGGGHRFAAGFSTGSAPAVVLGQITDLIDRQLARNVHQPA